MRFVNVNVAALRRRQAQRAGARGRRAARARRRCARRSAGWRADAAWSAPRCRRGARVGRGGRAALTPPGTAPLPSQAEVIGAVNDAAGERDVVVCAAGSMPGDLHKLWRARDPDGKGYHVEYGYSCMGYEIPGGMGVKLAAPEREVFVMVGDGSYLMRPGELATAVAEGDQARRRARRQPRLRVDRRALALGRRRRLRHPLPARGERRALLDAEAATARPTTLEALPIDLAANAESLGARVLRARTIDELRDALRGRKARRAARSSCTSRSTATRACRATRAGGTCRWPRSADDDGGARRARGVRARPRATSAATWSGPVSELLVRPRQQPADDGTLVDGHARVGGLGARRLRGARARRRRGRPSASTGDRELLRRRDRRARARALRARRLADLGGRADPFAGRARRRLPAARRRRFPSAGRRRAEVGALLRAGRRAAPQPRVLPAGADVQRSAATARTSARIHPILMGDQRGRLAARRARCSRPPGHWSSYPPHKHDRDALPEESLPRGDLLPPHRPRAQGFGLQRVYTGDGTLDETRRGARPRHRARAARLPHGLGPARVRALLPQRDGRARRGPGPSRTTPTTNGCCA